MQILILQGSEDRITVSSATEAISWIEQKLSLRLLPEEKEMVEHILSVAGSPPIEGFTKIVNRYATRAGKTIDLVKGTEPEKGFRILGIFYPTLFNGEAGRIAYLYADRFNNTVRFQFVRPN